MKEIRCRCLSLPIAAMSESATLRGSVLSGVTLTSAKVMFRHLLPDDGMSIAGGGVWVPERLPWELCIHGLIIDNAHNVLPRAVGFICVPSVL